MLTPHTIPAQAREVWVRDCKIHCLVWEPLRPRVVLLMLHGLESHSRWFTDLGTAQAQAGSLVIAIDRPGSGKSGGIRGDLLCLPRLVEVLMQVLAELAPAGLPCVCLGFSWGARWTLYAALTHPRRFQGLILLSPGLALRVGYGSRQKLFIALASWIFPQARFPTPITTEEMFISREPHREWIRQDSCRNRTVTARLLWLSRVMERKIRAGRIDPALPVLCLQAEQDVICDNGKTLQQLRQMMPPENLECLCFTGAEHALVFETDCQPVSDRISTWLADSLFLEQDKTPIAQP